MYERTNEKEWEQCAENKRGKREREVEKWCGVKSKRYFG